LSIHLQTRKDGSLTLSISGDLQLDSRDERIYHETIVLPALALVKKRRAQEQSFFVNGGKLRVLIAGGGDGLCAREVLKESAVGQVVLVDYDSKMIGIGKNELAELNEQSLHSPLVEIKSLDAFDYVTYQIEDNAQDKFDLIICDFTVPRTADEARVLGVEWFELLAKILTPDGIIAVNGISPTLYTDAFWSIYNSLRTAALQVKPMRVPLPSFRAAGYGPDWGFFLAGLKPFEAARFYDDLVFAAPAKQLKTVDQWRKLFVFPEGIVGRRAFSRPTGGGSDLLITYLSNPSDPVDFNPNFDFLALGADLSSVPDIDFGLNVLPEQLTTYLADQLGVEDEDDISLNAIIEAMTEYVPALDPHHSRSMVETFLIDPLRFIRSIDLAALVEKLLQRAAELPAKLIAELRSLKDKLKNLVYDKESILALGSKALAVIALVVILGNLVFADNAYGKGGHGGGYGTVADSPGSLSRPGHSGFDNGFAPSEWASGPGFRANMYGRGRAVDETGFVFPARRYRYYGSNYSNRYYVSHPQSVPPSQIYAAYRLTPEADVLTDGSTVISLTDDAYLLLGPTCNTLIDAWSGVPIVDLARDPAQAFRVCREIERQTDGLKQSLVGKQTWMKWVDWLDFMPWYGDDASELANLTEMEGRLEKARAALGNRPGLPPALATPPVVGAIEIFASVWLAPDGLSLIVNRPEGLAYYNEKGWFKDAAMKTALADAYPKNLGRVVVSFYRKEVKDQSEMYKRIYKELGDANADYSGLMNDYKEFKACYVDTQGYESVDYGSITLSLDDAVARTQKDMEIASQRIKLVQVQLDRLPRELQLAQAFIAKYAPLYVSKVKAAPPVKAVSGAPSGKPVIKPPSGGKAKP
jgi:spermidine synthase